MKKMIALVMVALLIQLPVFVAADIRSYHIAGTKGVNQVVDQEDTLTVKATVSVSGDPNITADQVWLGNSLPFTDCAADIGGWLCTLSLSQREYSGETPFAINLHTDNHANPPTTFTLVDKVTGTLVVDTLAPRVEVVLGTLKARHELPITFKAYDDSFVPNKFDNCAGLKEIIFKVGTSDTGFSYQPNTCQTQEHFSFNVSQFTEGKHTLKVTATDYLDHTFERSYDFEVDRTGVVFENLQILSNGEKVSHIGRNAIPATVTIEVSGDASSVSADLSAFDDQSSSVLGQCIENICSWDVMILPSAFGTKTLKFSGTDDVGNFNSQQMMFLLQQDITGPQVKEISTWATSASTLYLSKANNTIKVVFDEGGAGLSASQVYLDLSDLGGAEKEPADSCRGDVCVWESLNFVLQDGSYDLSVNPDTTDVLGNPLQERFTKEVIVDTKAPQLIGLEVHTIGGNLHYEGVTLFDDSLEVVARLLEPGEMSTAVGDFSAVVSDAYRVLAESCKYQGENIWECRWLTEPIDIPGYIKDDILFTFNDFLGNSVEYTKSITVYAIDDTEVDHFTVDVDCSPSQLDREVTSIFEQRVYCRVKLEGNAVPVSIELDDCTGDAQFFRKEEILNNQLGSKDPYIKLTLHEADIDQDELKISCPLLIVSKTDQSVNKFPEVENVTLTIPFYNQPLGEYGDSLQQKINDAVDDANGGIFELATDLNQLFFYGERICSLVTTINNVASLINSVGMLKRGIAKQLITNAATAPAGQTLEEAGKADQSITSVLNSKMKDSFLGTEDPENIINKFCKFISCRLFFDEEWVPEEVQGIGGWQRSVLENANLVATGNFGDLTGSDSGNFGEDIGLGGRGVNAYTFEEGAVDEHGGTSPNVLLQGGKLNPKDSIVLSFATLCIPGIMNHLDRYRQIKCVYADCLQTSADTGVLTTTCEEVKESQTCKYIYGEVFQLMPFTGLLNNIINLVKGALSSPFGIIDIALGYVCSSSVQTPYAGKVAQLCLVKEVAGMIADIWSDLANIQDDWKINTDYCENLEKVEVEDEE